MLALVSKVAFFDMSLINSMCKFLRDHARKSRYELAHVPNWEQIRAQKKNLHIALINLVFRLPKFGPN